MIRVKLSEAAHALLETDRDGLNAERGISVDGAYIEASRREMLDIRDTFAEWANGWRDADNPGAAKRTATAAIKAIDKVLKP